jgi:cobalt-zinc-cadmium efflux system membrane fusion protein
MMKYYLWPIATLILFSFFSCDHGGRSGEGNGSEEDAAPAPEGEIVLTRNQFESSGMRVGDPVPMRFVQEVSATGYIDCSLSGKAKINTLIAGRVRQINHSVGETVETGSVLLSLESQEIIMIQEEYARAFQEMQLLKSDYDRLKSLSEEKIAATKDFLKAESEFNSRQAEVEGLRMRLKLIQIDPSQIEQGTIVPFIQVRSPIQGTVSRLEVVPGQFVEPNVTAMEIVDSKRFRVRLQVFEKSVTGVVPGQKVQFSTPDQPQEKHQAILTHIGRSIDPETRTVLCYADIDPADRGSFFENMYIEATVTTCDREALAVPEQALLRQGERDYALVLVDEKEDRMTFRKIPVRTGNTRNGFTEVLDQDLSGVLLEGAFNLWSSE